MARAAPKYIRIGRRLVWRGFVLWSFILESVKPPKSFILHGAVQTPWGFIFGVTGMANLGEIREFWGKYVNMT